MVMENGIDHRSQLQDEDNRQTTAPMISVRDVTVSFGRQTVLDKLSLEIYRGEVLGFIGPSGRENQC